jgi:hypothetical protein
MTGGERSDADQDGAVRRVRYALYLIGGAFTALALMFDQVPALASVAPSYAVKACSLVAVSILSTGRFGSNRFLSRLSGCLRNRD